MSKFDLAIKALSAIVDDISADGFGTWAIPEYQAAIRVLEAAEKVNKREFDDAWDRQGKMGGGVLTLVDSIPDDQKEE